MTVRSPLAARVGDGHLPPDGQTNLSLGGVKLAADAYILQAPAIRRDGEIGQSASDDTAGLNIPRAHGGGDPPARTAMIAAWVGCAIAHTTSVWEVRASVVRDLIHHRQKCGRFRLDVRP